jgi:hypothetical protein
VLADRVVHTQHLLVVRVALVLETRRGLVLAFLAAASNVTVVVLVADLLARRHLAILAFDRGLLGRRPLLTACATHP